MMDLTSLKIPQHIAIIMDGNGRWAKQKHKPRTFGHAEGAKTLERILEDCDDLGVRFLTVYAFSTENWSRPLQEVQVIMKLFRDYLIKSIDKCMKNNVRCQIIGDRSALSDELIECIDRMEQTTKDNTGITFNIAINYGSRDEILRSVRHIAEDVKAGLIDPDEINGAILEKHLDTAGMPDPDLLIRTSGEQRLSNYLLWQLAYTEFYFTDVYWPDFDKTELLKAIEQYSKRDRRYGGIEGNNSNE